MWYNYHGQVTMLNKININSRKQILIVYFVLAIAALAVFWQVNQFDFISIDDDVYVTENSHVQSGITLDGFRWAFSTTYAEFWHPLTWLSLMFDYQFHGLHAGGYHLTNLLLHIMSTLLLFWLFNRMTGAIWRSAFVAALFALHPLRVESVAWVGERKDVLSVFFWMLTLCLYIYYTEKPVIKRYLPVLLSFACGLMSKSTIVTLPLIMILLDYWPLSRFPGRDRKLSETGIMKIIPLWQLREKIPFFILSAFFSIITYFAHYEPFTKNYSLGSRIANALVSFISYLAKTFWPHDLAVFYPFSAQLPVWQVLGSALLIIVISAAVIITVRRLPYLFVGWLWYLITLLPVIGIIQIGNFALADRFTYLPSIGIGIMLAWGVPLLFKREEMRNKILFPAAVAALAILAIVTWRQCGYWKNSIELSNHTLQVTKNNYLAYNNRGIAYAKLDQYQLALEDFSAMSSEEDYADAYYNRGIVYDNLRQYQNAIENYNKAINLHSNFIKAYNNRGTAYDNLGQYQLAIENYNKAVSLKTDNAISYFNRANIYAKIGQYLRALEDFNKAISLNKYYADAYNNRGNAYTSMGQYQLAIADYSKAISLKPDYAYACNNRGTAYAKLGQYQLAIEDYNRAISLKEDYALAYNNRGFIYLNQGNKEQGCRDVQKACALEACTALEWAKSKRLCR
jgi:tetratricopeptide (TPR) repeat protein